MPQQVEVKYFSITDRRSMRTTVSCATEEELLEFANKVRQAGGANVLEALLPSRTSEPNECLIANALNFNCLVNAELGDSPGEYYWYMEFPFNTSKDQVQRIAEITGTDPYRVGGMYRLNLPQEIGNAAHAFDDGAAFQHLVIHDET